MDDPNINPVYDALLGYDTNSGVMRLMAMVVAFIVIGGSTFYLLGH